MTAPIINQLPEAPNPNDRTTFNSKAFTWSSALPSWTTQTNALGSWMNTTAGQVASGAIVAENAITAINNSPGAISLSTSSVAYGLGTKTFVVPLGKVYAVGQFLLITDSANVANYMIGQVTNYSSGNLVVNSVEFAGSGSNNNWTISVTGKPNSVGSAIASASSKTTPVDADSLAIVDSTAGNILKRLTFTNLKTWIASYLNTGVSGNILSVSGGIGYSTGAGGSVTQSTSKSTTVVLNKPSGQITMHSAELAAGASVEFVLSNTFLSSLDGLVVNPNGYAGYSVEVAYFAGFTDVVLRVTNKGATRSDALVINFRIIKGAIS